MNLPLKLAFEFIDNLKEISKARLLQISDDIDLD